MTGILDRPLPLAFIGATVLLLATAGAPAAATPAPAAGSASNVVLGARLSDIKINGSRVPLPVVLQVVKSALHRPWSSAWKDRNLVVCRTPEVLGTRFRTLSCETNAKHMREVNALQTALVTASAHAGGMFPANDVLASRTAGAIDIAALEAVLTKLPPANSSYTLRVTNHGKPKVDYVFENGNLVHIYRYSYAASAPARP